jgi:hypothetical protein
LKVDGARRRGGIRLGNDLTQGACASIIGGAGDVERRQELAFFFS